MFDPLSPQFQRNPYPVYEQLRASAPIYYHPELKMWFCATYDDVSTLLRDKRLGRTMDHILSREERGIPPDNPAYEPFLRLGRHSMFDKEPPEHTRLKSLVHKVFTPRRVESLRERIQFMADSLIDAAIPRCEMDLLEDFAVPLPVTVIAELLGIPEADRDKLRPWSNNIVKMYELNPGEDSARAAVQAAQEFADYLKTLARQRLIDPQDDLITALAQVEESGEVLSEDELISTCVLLLNAGHEATVNVIGNGMTALLQHPDELAAVKADTERVKTAVEEMMRYDSPLQLFRRWVLEDMTYKGIEFKQGEEIALLFGSANRDSDRFAQPTVFDTTRQDNAHISFGGGVHYCLGAPLARLELNIAVTTLLNRLPNIQLAEVPVYKPAYVIRGLEAVHITF